MSEYCKSNDTFNLLSVEERSDETTANHLLALCLMAAKFHKYVKLVIVVINHSGKRPCTY